MRNNVTLPKSLHTVSALVNLALHIRDTGAYSLSPAALVGRAAVIIGYDGAADPHGLRQVAARKVDKVLRA